MRHFIWAFTLCKVPVLTGIQNEKCVIEDCLYFKKKNSADPDEMLPYAAFHLGLHCLAKYLFTGIDKLSEYVVRPPDKSAYWKTIFFISHPKHMLWALKRTVSMRRFFCAPKTHV